MSLLVITGVAFGVLNALHNTQARGAGEYVDGQELTLPEHALVTSVETDLYSGIIHYTTDNGCSEQTLELELPPVWGMVGGSERPVVAPMAVIVNEDLTGLQEWQGGYYWSPEAANMEALEGKLIKELKATRRDVYTAPHPTLGVIHYTSQWIVETQTQGSGEATASCSGGNTDTGNNNGSNQNQNPGAQGTAKAEGFIQEISLSDSSVVVGKEDKNTQLSVTNTTDLTLNGARVALSDLQAGDKVEKAVYDPATDTLLQLTVKREQ